MSHKWRSEKPSKTDASQAVTASSSAEDRGRWPVVSPHRAPFCGRPRPSEAGARRSEVMRFRSRWSAGLSRPIPRDGCRLQLAGWFISAGHGGRPASGPVQAAPFSPPMSRTDGSSAAAGRWPAPPRPTDRTNRRAPAAFARCRTEKSRGS